MKYIKMLGMATAVAIGLTTAVVSVASATTLGIGGVSQNKAVTIWAVGESGTSTVLKDTNNLTQDTCTEPALHLETGVFTGASVSGTVSTLAWFTCTHTTHTIAAGSLSISRIGSTTNGTLTSSGAEWTFKSTVFGLSLVCKTGSGTDIGTLTGAPTSADHATIDVNAVVNCGFFCPTAVLSGRLTVETPNGLGVES
jgi:hypothetical protein